MPTPNYSIVFSAQLVAASSVQVGKLLLPSSDDGTSYVVATTANRGTRRCEGIALTAWNVPEVGSVQMQQSGTIDATVSGLTGEYGSKSLVRCSATGTIERIATASVDPATDDVIGYAEEDGRVHLYFGYPFAEMLTIAGGGVNSFGGSNADVLIRASSTTTTGVSPGTSGNVLTSNGTAWTSAAAPGGTPGASDTYFQWNNAGAFAGAAGLIWHAGTSRPDMPNGWRSTVSGSTATFVITPTGARTITFQDATHTVVGRDTTDTLTNKTINASDNTITDTSQAQYDLLVNNGTKFVRFAKGSDNRVLVTNGSSAVAWAQVSLTTMVTGTLPVANGGTNRSALGSALQVLRTNAGATDTEWATLSTGSPGGSNLTVQFNDSSTFDGATKLRMDSATAATANPMAQDLRLDGRPEYRTDEISYEPLVSATGTVTTPIAPTTFAWSEIDDGGTAPDFKGRRVFGGDAVGNDGTSATIITVTGIPYGAILVEGWFMMTRYQVHDASAEGVGAYYYAKLFAYDEGNGSAGSSSTGQPYGTVSGEVTVGASFSAGTLTISYTDTGTTNPDDVASLRIAGDFTIRHLYPGPPEDE